MCCRTQTRYGYGQWRPNDGVSRTLTASVAVCSKRKKTQKQNHNFIVFCSPFPETVRAELFCFCLFCLFFPSFFYFSRAFASSFRHFGISSLNYHFVLIYRVSVIYCNFVVIFEKQIQPIKLKKSIANNKIKPLGSSGCHSRSRMMMKKQFLLIFIL